MAPHLDNKHPILVDIITTDVLPRIQRLKRSYLITTAQNGKEKINNLLDTTPGKAAIFGTISLAIVVLVILIAVLCRVIGKRRKDPSSRSYKQPKECPWTPTIASYEAIQTSYNTRDINGVDTYGCPEIILPDNRDNYHPQGTRSFSYDPGMVHFQQKSTNVTSKPGDTLPVRSNCGKPMPIPVGPSPPSQARVSHSRNSSCSSQSPCMFNFIPTPRATSPVGFNQPVESLPHPQERKPQLPTLQTSEPNISENDENEIDTTSIKRVSILNRHSSYHSNWGSPMSCSTYQYSSIHSNPTSMTSIDSRSSIDSDHYDQNFNKPDDGRADATVPRSLSHIEGREKLIDNDGFENVSLVDEVDEKMRYQLQDGLQQGMNSSVTSPQISRAFSFK